MNLNRADGGNRKYILVEMGEHFNTVILPRVKKVAFSDKWKDGKAVLGNGSQGMSHFVKYFRPGTVRGYPAPRATAITMRRSSRTRWTNYAATSSCAISSCWTR